MKRKFYVLSFTHDDEGVGIFDTEEQAQNCINLMLNEYGDEISPDDFTIEEQYLQ